MNKSALAGFAPLTTLGEHWQVTSQTAAALLAERSVRTIRRSGRIYVAWLDIWRLEGLTAPSPEDFDHLRRPLLRRRDVEARYGISERTALRWMSSGELPVIRLSPRILRLRESELDRLDDLQMSSDGVA